MNDKPKRRFWQIHLSTAVLMTLVAGFCLWFNIETSIDMDTDIISRGWPNTAWLFIDGSSYFFRKGILVNAFYALSILFNVAFLSEYLIRRRESRKP